MEQQVKGPAIGLIATGALGLLLAIVNVGMMALGMSMSRGDVYADMELLNSITSGAIGFALAVVNVGVSGFILWAGLRMVKLEQFAVCRVASIVAMIPCFACCLVGLPIGIWALVVMSKPEVRAAFKS